MSQRDELLRQFGPALIEALALIILDEINTLRDFHGLPPRAVAQIIAAIKNKLQVLDPYDWMIIAP